MLIWHPIRFLHYYVMRSADFPRMKAAHLLRSSEFDLRQTVTWAWKYHTHAPHTQTFWMSTGSLYKPKAPWRHLWGNFHFSLCYSSHQEDMKWRWNISQEKQSWRTGRNLHSKQTFVKRDTCKGTMEIHILELRVTVFFSSLYKYYSHFPSAGFLWQTKYSQCFQL